MPGADAFVDIAGMRLHYREHGDAAAPPLVCLHGVAMEAHGWDRFAASVGDRRRVLALTARGHGDSDRASEYGAMQHIADSAAFIDALVGGPVTVCGLSMGGGTAIGLAAMHPDKVAKLVIVDVGPVNPAGIARIGKAFEDAPEAWDSYEEALPVFHAGYGDVADDVLLDYMRHVLQLNADGKLRPKLDPLVAKSRTPANADPSAAEAVLWAACAAITCPTLIVRGAKSDILLREGAERMAAAIGNARVVEVDAGHVVPLENSAGFYEAVRDFI